MYTSSHKKFSGIPIHFRRVTSLLRTMLFLAVVATISNASSAGTLFGGRTDEANNDDYTGDFGDVNFNGWLNLAGFDSDQLFVIEPSGGTTEYSFRFSGNFSSPADAIYVQVGFGVGDGFESAATIFPELDFDAPLPGTPAPSSDVFSTAHHLSHLIQYSGGLASGIAFAAAELLIDVPDLPVSVNDYYTAEQLPNNLPEGAAVFTIRKHVGTFGSRADFNLDGVIDCVDVDSLVMEIAAGTNNPAFDLTGDGFVNLQDLEGTRLLSGWLQLAGGQNLGAGLSYLTGDANLDGVVDGLDFMAWNANKFTSVAAWCNGDFTADGEVDEMDFLLWNDNKFTTSGGLSAVPESGLGTFLIAALIGWVAVRCR